MYIKDLHKWHFYPYIPVPLHYHVSVLWDQTTSKALSITMSSITFITDCDTCVKATKATRPTGAEKMNKVDRLTLGWAESFVFHASLKQVKKWIRLLNVFERESVFELAVLFLNLFFSSNSLQSHWIPNWADMTQWMFIYISLEFAGKKSNFYQNFFNY